MAKLTLNREFEVKEVGSNDGTFTGIASVFGEIDSYRDIVIKGAFKNSIKEFAKKGRKVPMLWQHRVAEPIGIYTKLEETDEGLIVEGAINMEVQQGREAHALMKQGALTGLSIGYETIAEKFIKKNEVQYRELHEVKLWEISPVTFPAGDTARVDSVKSILSLSDAERILREAGFSKSEATLFVNNVRGVASLGEPATVSTKKKPTIDEILATLS